MPSNIEITDADDAAIKRAAEAQTRQAWVDRRLADCGVPLVLMDSDKHVAATLPEAGRAVWQTARMTIHAAVGTGAIFGLIGPPGTGKSTLGAGIVLEVSREGRPDMALRYITADAYIKALEASRKFHSRLSLADIQEKHCRPTFLVIDEIDRPAPSEFGTVEIQSLIQRRWDLKRCTLLIANDEQASFEQRVGPPIVSRMFQSGGLFQFAFPDARKVQKARTRQVRQDAR